MVSGSFDRRISLAAFLRGGYAYDNSGSWEIRQMKISARNRLKGKVTDIVKGATTAHVRIDIGNGIVVTASITNEAVDELELKVGGEAYAVVKASDVMVAID
jgi:molybdopterin-binding protein